MVTTIAIVTGAFLVVFGIVCVLGVSDCCRKIIVDINNIRYDLLAIKKLLKKKKGN